MLNHQGTKQIESENLILRKFTIDDAEAVYKNWASDEKVTKYLTWKPHADIQETKSILTEWIRNYSQKEYYNWAIVYRENGFEPVGSISVVSLNNEIMKAHIGYCLGKAWWHQGIMSEALSRVISFLIDEVGMERIDARHDTRNPHSGEVMKKCGMKYEGTLRQADWNNSGIHDSSWYAILASDRKG